ncbi:citrinin biosynthesis oxidoreductase protein [Rutstroemia sp. NJR-2017a BVV2]|nr:citrinin biosynthesis oxidoreductase protein [Rutstroemia sp. NJR-2017a BVV2]
MQHDNETGATGDWVAVLGFSQGDRMAASLLYRQQVYKETRLVVGTTSEFRFGILLAGSAPLISLDPNMTLSHPLPMPRQLETHGKWIRDVCLKRVAEMCCAHQRYMCTGSWTQDCFFIGSLSTSVIQLRGD